MAEAVGAGGDAGGGEAGGETSGGGKGLADRGKLKAKTSRRKKMQSAEMDAQVCTMVSVSVCVCCEGQSAEADALLEASARVDECLCR